MMRMPYTKREIAGIIIAVGLFVIAQRYALAHAAEMQAMIGAEERLVGMVIYGLIAIGAIVVAPISSLPLVPIAAAAWGSFATLVVTVITWTIGSIAAFLLARRYGKKILGRVVDLESMQRLESMMDERDVFVSALLLRMIIPVDILSYALGLFSTIRLVPYIVATLIGIIPFTIFFSYAIIIPMRYQVALAIGMFALITGIIRYRLRNREKMHNSAGSAR